MWKFLFKDNYVKTILICSIFLNIGMAMVLFYVSLFKTDLFYKAIYKIGLIEYDVSLFRHNIEYRCLEGWSNSLKKQRIKSDVVFYGNSIIYESDFPKFYPQLNICNMGCNRDNLDDLIHRSFLIKSVLPRKVFILGGINSLLDIKLDRFEEKYEALVDTIIIQNPNAKIYLQSLLPVNIMMEVGARYKGSQDMINEANKIIRKISHNKGCYYVDLYSAYQINDSMPRKYTRDGLHLYPEAYSIWAKSIYPYLVE